MEHKRISIFVSAFLLCLLSACQMTGVTDLNHPEQESLRTIPADLFKRRPPLPRPPPRPPHPAAAINLVVRIQRFAIRLQAYVQSIKRRDRGGCASSARGRNHREQSWCQFAGPGLPAATYNHQQNYILLR